MTWRRLVASMALVTSIAGVACSSSSSKGGAGTSCAADPTVCQAGTTCWPADSVPNLECLASDPGAGFGAMCDQTIGYPTCGDRLACDQTGASGGSCTSYCNANAPCPAGYSCRTTQVGTGSSAPSIDICRPAGLVLDASMPPPSDASDTLDVLGLPPVDGAMVEGGPAKQ